MMMMNLDRMIRPHSSVVEDIEESLIEFLLPQFTLRSYSNNDQTLIWPRVDIDEFTLLWHVVGLASTLRVCLRLIQTISDSHIHLHLNSSQINLLIVISCHQILVAVVPEQRMSLDLNELILRGSCQTICVVLEVIQVVKLHWND